jgi:TPR repeat protein
MRAEDLQARYLKRPPFYLFVTQIESWLLCLDQGKGVRIDFKAGARYFKLAADQGFVDT